MPQRDYFDVLGVPRGSSEEDIRRAYRRLARTHHPDLNPLDSHAEARFKEINEAYETLSDPDRRRSYERFGHRGAGAAPDYHSGNAMPNMDTLMEQLLHGVGRRSAGQRRGPRPSANVEHPIQISLAEAMLGTTRRVELTDNRGETRMLEVQIQPGVAEGTRIRIAGQGTQISPSGARGDLYLIVKIAQDSGFRRDGDDLYAVTTVSLFQALLGGEVQIATPSGSRLALTLPPESQPGARFRLAGQGMPRLQSDGRGDLYVDLAIRLPTNLTAKERKLVTQLAQLRGE